MRNRYSLGEVVRVNLDLISAGVGATGQSPTIAIQRRNDSKWYRVTDDTWQIAIVNNAMVETDDADLPGRYHFDFDQTLDDLVCRGYVAKKLNTGSPDVLEYEDMLFGPLAASMAPNLCAITGTVYTASGQPAGTQYVRATLIPVFTDALARGTQSDRVVLVATDQNGDFSISLVRGGTFRLEIPSIGYDRKAIIPDEDTVLFTDL